MTNRIKQEYIANNQDPLVLLTSENGKPMNLIGHLVIAYSEKIWVPYKIGDKMGFEPLHMCFTKYLETGCGKFGSVNKELKSPEGLLFLLADGIFPYGCRATTENTVLAVKTGEKDPFEISKQIDKDLGAVVEKGYDAKLHTKATGKISLLKNVLNVHDFSESYFQNPQVYMDTIAGLMNNYKFKDGTPIRFHANMNLKEEGTAE